MFDDFLYDVGCSLCDGRSAKPSDGSSSNNACAQARFVALQAEVGRWETLCSITTLGSPKIGQQALGGTRQVVPWSGGHD